MIFLTYFTFLWLWVKFVQLLLFLKVAAMIGIQRTLDSLDITYQSVNKRLLTFWCKFWQRLGPNFHLQSNVCYRVNLMFTKNFSSFLQVCCLFVTTSALCSTAKICRCLYNQIFCKKATMKHYLHWKVQAIMSVSLNIAQL